MGCLYVYNIMHQCLGNEPVLHDFEITIYEFTIQSAQLLQMVFKIYFENLSAPEVKRAVKIFKKGQEM